MVISDGAAMAFEESREIDRVWCRRSRVTQAQRDPQCW